LRAPIGGESQRFQDTDDVLFLRASPHSVEASRVCSIPGNSFR